jgi:uncharacterized membrane protein
MTAPSPVRTEAPRRIASIDLLRGAVMLIMAIDHVRVYSGQPAGGPAPGIFFTRWITHFCAPAFVFLAGSSAYFYARRHKDVARFLVVRGVWLIFLELTVLRLAWTFNLDFKQYEMAGILWCIGWCMILLAPMTRLPLKVAGAIGVAIIAAHNLLDSHLGAIIQGLHGGVGAGVWKIVYLGFFAGPITFGPDGPNLIVLFSIVPWVGVIAAGYVFGAVFAMEPERRNRICLRLGLGAIALFLVLRWFDGYGNLGSWRGATVARPDGPPAYPGFLSFLNTNKYPASLDFVLMTLGPMIALVPLAERARGAAANWVSTFGRVPFFYYMVHIPLIHALALGVSLVRTGAVDPWLFTNHPMGTPTPPNGYPWGLPLLYLVWAIAVAMLTFICRWFERVKARRDDWWLKYL